MAITHKYVDPNAGNDANTGDSDAQAYKTMQKALDAITDGSGGQQINLKAGTAEVLASVLNWTSFSPTNSSNNPLMIRGYTSVESDGGIGEIDGNNAVANILTPTSHAQYVYLIDLKLHNTTGDVVDMPANCGLLRCEVYNGGSGQTIDIISNSTFAIGCYVHSGTSGAIGIQTSSRCLIVANFITQHDDNCIQTVSESVIALNLLEAAGGSGIATTGQLNAVFNNTVVSDGTGSSKRGILLTGTSDRMVIFSNILKDWSGTGHVALNYDSGANALFVGYNNLHNNTTDISGELIFGVDNTGSDTTTDPTFTDAASDDYRVGTNAQADGYPTVFKGASLTTTSVDVGCSQRLASIIGGAWLAASIMSRYIADIVRR